MKVCENYVIPPLARTFPQIDPARRNQAVLDDEVGRLRAGLALLAQFIDDAPYATGGALSLADCLIHPTLQLCGTIGSRIGVNDLVAVEPVLAGYFEKARTDPFVGGEAAATDAALAARAAAAASS